MGEGKPSLTYGAHHLVQRKEIIMATVKSIWDGTLTVKPLSYVLGDDWTYLYSDSWKGVEFDVHACMNGEVVAVVDALSSNPPEER